VSLPAGGVNNVVFMVVSLPNTTNSLACQRVRRSHRECVTSRFVAAGVRDWLPEGHLAWFVLDRVLVVAP
jgi:hypothetical protein